MAHLLAELGWPDIAAYLENDDRIILPIGSTEQHGRHLPLDSDVQVPTELARRLSDRTGVLVTPTVPFGMSVHHLGFPGSLSLRPETLIQVMEDLLRSLYRGCFRRIVILNGHGGNVASIELAQFTVMTDLPLLEVRVRNWWTEPVVCDLLQKTLGTSRIGHADAAETSPLLALRPDRVRLERAQYNADDAPIEALTEHVFRDRFPYGVIGKDPHLASAELGEQLLSAVTDKYAQQLVDWRAHAITCRHRLRVMGENAHPCANCVQQPGSSAES